MTGVPVLSDGPGGVNARLRQAASTVVRAHALLASEPARIGSLAGVGIVAFLIFTRVLFPAPAPILFLGAVLGSLSALIAMGVVLVYRSTRIINFAQGDLGAISGMLGVLLISGPHWPYFPSLLLGLLAALALGAIVEFVFVRRFADAPRLILTVATIGIAQLLAAGELFLPRAFGRNLAPQNFPAPFRLTFRWEPVIFQGGHVLAIVMVIAAGAGLTAFFRLTRIGVAIRAAAESSERAAQVGVPVRRLGTFVWVLAAALSALASLLRAPLVGVPIGSVLGPALLLRALAAAVIARMYSLPVAFGASVVLGMAEQAVFWHTGRTVVADAVLFCVIIAALLFQRRGSVSRADDAAISSWQMVRSVRAIPRELRSEPEVRAARYGVAALVFAALAVLPLFLAPSRVNLLGAGVILAMVGVSLVVLTGWAGEISLGQMALFGVGAATAVKLYSLGGHFLLCLLAAGTAGAVASVVIGIPALRIRGPFLAVATFSFALVTSSFFLNREFFPWFVVDSRLDRPVLFGKFALESEYKMYYVLLLMLGVVLASVRSLRNSRTGRVLIAGRDNVRAVQSAGVNVLRARLVAFATSGFFAALAGGAFAFHQHALARSAFVPEQSIRIFSMVVFGGLGSLPGVVLGAAYFTAIDYFLPFSGTRLLVSGVGLLIVLMVFPGGVGQVVYDLRDRFLMWVARRRDIIVPSLAGDRRAEMREADPVVAGRAT
jgi:branched-chain amino acid transport system permease protein